MESDFSMVWLFGGLITFLIAWHKGQPGAGLLGGIVFGPFGILIALLSSSARPKGELVTRARSANKSNDPEKDIESTQENARGLSAGTGFFINDEGYLLTNNHVVSNHSKIRIKCRSNVYDARLVEKDQVNDLAVLQSNCPVESIALFKESKALQTGESIIVVGFPLGGAVSSRHTATTGIISSEVGFGDDSRLVQITAPVHGGNSGGPLLDQSGAVVGIVSSKINDIAVMQAVGEVPQNINFAIKSSMAMTFLNSCGVDYLTTYADEKIPTTEIIKDAKAYVVKIEAL